MNTAFEFDRGAAHFRDAPDFDLGAIEIGVEQRHAVRRTLAVGLVRGARQQQDLVGDLRRRRPHLAALHDVAFVRATREGLDARRVETGVRLGHAEAGLLLALDERRQPARLLRLRSVHDDRVRAEYVQVDGRRRGIAAAALPDRVHHDRGFGDTETRAADLRRHGDAEPARIGHGAMELVGKARRRIAIRPIVVAETRTDLGDAVGNGAMLGGESDVHAFFEFWRSEPSWRTGRRYLTTEDAKVARGCAEYRARPNQRASPAQVRSRGCAAQLSRFQTESLDSPTDTCCSTPPARAPRPLW